MADISVCLALYNGSEYIIEQLHSILGQLSDNDELIISDDGSTDNSIELVRRLNDPRIRIVYHKNKNDLVKNFEHALAHAGGRYIFLSDQDDIWEEDKIRTMVKLLRHHDLVVCDCSLVDQNGQVIRESFFKRRRSGNGFIKNLLKNSYIGCCMAFNRSILDKSLPFPPQIPMHDWWIGMMSEIYGNPFFYGKPLVKYRRHGNNYSAVTKSNYTLFEQLIIRVQLTAALCIRVCLGR